MVHVPLGRQHARWPRQLVKPCETQLMLAVEPSPWFFPRMSSKPAAELVSMSQHDVWFAGDVQQEPEP
jgi:hypothetical protein